MWLESGDWRFARCKTCKGRPENWPPELTIITMEATMTAKKPTKQKSETELLAQLQLDLQSREKTLERLAGMLGCQPGDIERAMGEMQAHVQAIRDIVEPVVAEAKPATLPEACECLVRRIYAEHAGIKELSRHHDNLIAENDALQKQVEELKAELSDAEARIAKLEDENREAWVALDGAGSGTLIEVAEKRWKEIETLRAQLEAERNTIKRLERNEDPMEAAAPGPVELIDMSGALYREALADFGLRVLAGKVLVSFREGAL